MTWLWSVLADFVLNRLWGAWKEWRARKQGRQDAEREALRDTQERMEKGRDRLREHDSLDPDERLRRNDQRWK